MEHVLTWGGWLFAGVGAVVVAWQFSVERKSKRAAAFDERVKAIAQPEQTHAALSRIESKVDSGFETVRGEFSEVRDRVGDLGERVSKLEGRLERRHTDERRLGAEDRRAVFSSGPKD